MRQTFYKNKKLHIFYSDVKAPPVCIYNNIITKYMFFLENIKLIKWLKENIGFFVGKVFWEIHFWTFFLSIFEK